MDKMLAQVRLFLRGLTINQQLLLGGSAIVVALVIWLFVRLFGAVDYTTAYTDLDPADAQDIVQRLSVERISYQLSSDGKSLLVPADRLDQVRVEMASQSLPHTGRLGFELFDKLNWSSSDFSERVNYQRAIEGELERTIQTMDAVESARVHLVLPRDSLFSAEERPAKASVVVKLRSRKQSEQTVESIASLVASAWENLSPNDVTIVSADGRQPLTTGRSDSGPGRRGLSDLETTMAERVVDTLSPVIGPEHVKSSVTIEYNSNSGESTEEIYDPNATAVLTSQITQDQTTGAPAIGVPGTASNVPVAPPSTPPGASTPPSASGPNANATTATAATVPAGVIIPVTSPDMSQSVRNESKTFAVSKTMHHTIEPPGQIKHLAAAVLIDDFVEVKDAGGTPQETRRKRTPEEMMQFEELTKAALGFNAQRGDELSIQNVSFQVAPIEPVTPPTRIQETLRILTPWTGLLRYVALALMFVAIYLLVLKPVKKQVVATLRALPAPIPQAALAPGGKQEIGAGAPKTMTEFESELSAQLAATNSEVTRAVVLKRHLVDKVKKEPVGASRLIQSWVRQDTVGS